MGWKDFISSWKYLVETWFRNIKASNAINLYSILLPIKPQKLIKSSRIFKWYEIFLFCWNENIARTSFREWNHVLVVLTHSTNAHKKCNFLSMHIRNATFEHFKPSSVLVFWNVDYFRCVLCTHAHTHIQTNFCKLQQIVVLIVFLIHCARHTQSGVMDVSTGNRIHQIFIIHINSTWMILEIR